MPGIYLVRQDGSLVAMSETPYSSEGLLQELLAKYPSLLAGDQVDAASPRKWLLVSRETGVPDREAGADRWSVDHLFLDQDGIPTLVEVKRSTDSRIRREVIGQMLDYAANAVAYWPIETLQAVFKERCRSESSDPDRILEEFLGTRDPAEFWQAVKTNLQARRIRMVFVADVVPPELRRIVEFLNEQMDPAEVLALEVKQYIGDGQLRSLVPRLIGRTEQAQQKKAASDREVRQWDEDSFFSVLAGRGDAAGAKTARALLDWGTRTMSAIWWGRGKKSPSFQPTLKVGDTAFDPINISTGFKAPYVAVSFGSMTVPPFETPEGRVKLLHRLAEVPNVRTENDWTTRYPSFPLATLASDAALNKFLEVLDWSVNEVKRHNP
jgi:hypothetical protein